MATVTNREYIEKLIYDTYDALDPSGTNTDKMRSMLSEMSDSQFASFMKDFLSNDDEDDVYYKDWFTKIKNVWFDISQPERIELIQAFQCMILTASKYYLIANS